MADKLASLAVELSLQNEQFVKAIGQASQKLDEIGNAAKKSNANFDKMQAGVKNIGVALASAFAADKIVSGIRNIVNGFDDLSKAAQKAGVAAEDLQRLQYAADLSGVSAEKLQLSMGKLSVALTNIDDTSNESAKALKAMGLAAGADVQQALGAIADRFASMPDGAQKTAEAIKLFGKAGADLIPLLNQGAAGIKEMADEADRLGIVISGPVLQQAEQFNDNLTRMGKAAEGIGKNITAGMLPAMTAVSESFVELANAGEGWQRVGEVIGDGMLKLAEWGRQLAGAVQALGMGIGALGAVAENPTQAVNIFKAWKKDVDALDASVKAANQRMYQSRDVAAAGGPAGPPRPTARPAPVLGGGSANSASDAAARAAATEAKAMANLKLEYANLLQPMTNVQKLNAQVALGLVSQKDSTYELQQSMARYKDELVAVADAEKRRATLAGILLDIDREQAARDAEAAESLQRYNEELENFIATMDPIGTASEKFAANLERIDQLFFDGKINIEQYDRMLANLNGKMTENLTAMKTPLDLITEGFNGFFDNLARGTADASELFKRMVQSILANVAKLALNKLFVNLLGGALGLKLGGNGMSIVPSAKGNAFGGATGLPWGVYSQPTFFPMPGSGPLRKFATGGVLAEAGYPEAILPLRRGAGGRLGVEAQAPVVNVNVVNNAGAQVRTEQNGNDITIYIEQIKQAIARDIRSGAGAVTSAMQGTYGLSRAAGAR